MLKLIQNGCQPENWIKMFQACWRLLESMLFGCETSWKLIKWRWNFWPVGCLPTCSWGCMIGPTTDPGSVSVSACNPTCSRGCYPSDNPSPHPPTQHSDPDDPSDPLLSTHLGVKRNLLCVMTLFPLCQFEKWLIKRKLIPPACSVQWKGGGCLVLPPT